MEVVLELVEPAVKYLLRSIMLRAKERGELMTEVVDDDVLLCSTQSTLLH